MVMQLDRLREALGSPAAARAVLGRWRLHDAERAWRNLTHLAAAVGLDGLHALSAPLGRCLPRCPDPDMALNNLERFLANPDGAARLPALVENRGRTLEALLNLFAT